MNLRKLELNRERQRRWRYRHRIGKVVPHLELNVHGQDALIAAGYLDADLRRNKAAVGRAIVRALEDALRWATTQGKPATGQDRHGR